MREQVGNVLRRLALLHYYYAQAVVDELGPEKGKALVGKALEAYGIHLGQTALAKTLEKDLPPVPEHYQGDLPGWPWLDEEVMVDGEPRERTHHCPLAAVWFELGGLDIGRLYCEVDQAMIEGFNPDYEYIHFKTIPDGDPYCESVIRPLKEKKPR